MTGRAARAGVISSALEERMARRTRPLVVATGIGIALVLGAGSPAAPASPLFAVRVNARWGYIDLAGRAVIAPRFERAEPFSEGLAAVVLDGRHGYVDATGALVLVPRQRPAGPVHRQFSDGRAAVRDGGGVGFIDRGGRLAIAARFSSADDFSEGLAFACAAVGCGYVDDAGHGVFGPGLLGGAPFREGIAGVWVGRMGMGGKQFALYDRRRGRLTGEWESVGTMSEGLVAVRTQGLWGYVDRQGRGVIRPRFAMAGEFSGGLAPVAEQAWTCGYADRSGAIVIPLRFRSCHPFRDGRARVELLGPDPKQPRPAFIDREGRVVIDGAALSPPFQSASDFDDGLAAVEAPGTAGGTRLGYVDAAGRYVWPLTE
jgi:WG repeat protein